MIKYALRCSSGHGFDAWFSDSAAYDDQAAAGVVRCPECGTPDTGKAIMAPAVFKRGAKAKTAEDPANAAPPVAAKTDAAPLQPMSGKQMAFAGKMREALHELRQMVERNADYVGPKFAEEARKIHRGEAEERAIYGESSDADAEALQEEGIDVARIPWIDKHDA
jgi:hypothetical protein